MGLLLFRYLSWAGQEERRAIIWAQAVGVLIFPKTIPASGRQDLSLEALAEELTVRGSCLSSMGGILASASCIWPLHSMCPATPPFSIVMNWEEAVGSFTYIRQKQYLVEGLLGQEPRGDLVQVPGLLPPTL